MRSGNRSLTVPITVILAAISVPSLALGQNLPTALTKCNEHLARGARAFVTAALTITQQCHLDNLKKPGTCPASTLAEDLATRSARLETRIASGCRDVTTFGLSLLGFPGRCIDPTPSDDFTLDDLKSCISTTHAAMVDRLIDVEFGATLSGGTLPRAPWLCQRHAVKHVAKFTSALLNAVQRCRNAFNAGKLTGFDPQNCATADDATRRAIEKAEAKARLKIARKCSTADVQALDFCDPRATTEEAAIDCLIAAHREAVDDPDPTEMDLIDTEYPGQTPAPRSLCGDGTRNSLDEECDGNDDASCAGQCGAADGDFPCLCLDVPRLRIIEHAAGADLDRGWTGLDHDAEVVDGSSYVLDLYDCDNVTDFDCTVGPSCSGAPHPPCSNDADCVSSGLGTCRKTRQALGPHCNLDVQVVCENDADCPGSGNFCVTHDHGAPQPLSSGGVSVCVVNTFSEDVVGTTNLADGSGSLRMRQSSVTYLGPVADQPCPVCGGFCAGNLGEGGGVGQRHRCDDDSDCPNAPFHCVTDNICSYGPNADKACRPDPPIGGPTDLFGNPSSDCGPPPGFPISGFPGVDILFDPMTTGTVAVTPNVECNAPGFSDTRCVGGINEGRPCNVPGDCPGGSCNEQCFCPNDGGSSQRPNACNPACVSTGPDDAQPCATDAHCPTGFCHPADCRVDPSDTDSVQEGRCTTGPIDGQCSVTTSRPCSLGSDSDCRPPSEGGSCSFCDSGETCQPKRRECFVNSGIVRAGSAGAPDRVLAAIFCIPPTSSSAVNGTTGLPAPGALTQPITVHETGL